MMRTGFLLVLILARAAVVFPQDIAEPLTLRKAVELAVERSSPSQASDPAGKQAEVAACAVLTNSDSDTLLVSASELSSNLSSNENESEMSRVEPSDHLGREVTLSQRAKSDQIWSRDSKHSDVIFYIVLAYLKLSTVNLQLKISHEQILNTERLLKIETNRVLEHVDDISALTRAKLLMARAKLWQDRLTGSKVLLLNCLGGLTGIPSGSIDISLAAPSLPEPDLDASPLGRELNQSVDARDIAQLEYVLARADRMKKQIKNVLGTSNLGELVASYVKELDKLVELLQRHSDYLTAKVVLLSLEGRLETWNAICPIYAATQKERYTGAETPRLVVETKNSGTTDLHIRQILITPAVSKIKSGGGKQFSATVIYDNGQSVDATRQTKWKCSTDFIAILSTTGLLTPIEKGTVVLTATVGDKTQSHTLTIEEGDSTPLKP